MSCPECSYRGGSHDTTCPAAVEERNEWTFDDEAFEPVSLREGETRDDELGHAARNAAQLRMARASQEGDHGE